MRLVTSTLLLAGVLVAPLAMAHHSFAVHFEAEANKEVSGVVKNFRFANPHGMLYFDVTDANGVTTEWRAETTSPEIRHGSPSCTGRRICRA